MTNINLVTSSEENRTLGTGTGVLLLVFIFTALVYGALFFYAKKLNTDAEKLKAEYDSKFNSFIGGDARRVLDFQNRLIVSSELIIDERIGSRDVARIEELMIAGAYLGSYKYDDEAKKITLSCYADNYEIIAKQILSFKSSGSFPSVVTGETKLDAVNNKINFPIVLTIK